MKEYLFSSSRVADDMDIVLDTGATHHIFHDKSLFTSFSSTDKRVQTASGQLISVLGVGSIEFKVVNNFGDKFKTICLDNVWYIPSCTKNLISGSQLFSAGFGIHSSLLVYVLHREQMSL